MFGLLIVIQVLLAFLLIVVVLLQQGKGGGLAGAFGGGGNQTVFGGRGAVDFLGKATWYLGAAFMLNSLFLAMTAGGPTNQGLIEKSAAPPPLTAPAAPGTGTGLPVGTLPGDGSGDLDPTAAPGTTPAPATDPQSAPVPTGNVGSGVPQGSDDGN